MKIYKKRLLLINIITMLFFISVEVIESILPFFLVYSLGTSMFIVGLIEGLSDALSNLFKIVGGYFSDFQKRTKIIRFGLLSLEFSALLFSTVGRWSEILIPLFLKNIAEGSLIPARDSLISSIFKNKKAQIFSLNRVFENLGELIGISIAFVYSTFFINYYGYKFIYIFASTLVLISILVSFLLREKRSPKPMKKAISWKVLYPHYLFIFSFLSFINFGYSFYIIKVQYQTGNISLSIGLYLVFGIVLITSTILAGKYFDRVEEKVFLKATFLSFLISHIFLIIFPVFGFLLMAISDAMFEIGLWGTLGNKIKYREGFVFGAYHFSVGITSLISGIFIGYIWDNFGSDIPFYFGVCLSSIGYIYISKFRQ